MYCRNCGRKIPDDSNGEFCGFCGERVDGVEAGSMHGKHKGRSGRWKTILIAVLVVLLLCSLTVIGIFAFMFSKMSKMQQGGNGMMTAESGGSGPQAGKMPDQDMPSQSAPEGSMPEGNMPGGQTEGNMPGGQMDGSGQEMPDDMGPSSPPSGDDHSSDFGDGSMPSFGYGESDMPSGGPGGFGGGPGREMDEDWLGDDPKETLSSICKENAIPSDGEAVTDVSRLDGMFKAAEYDTASQEDVSFFRADLKADGENLTLEISDPGQFIGNGSDLKDITGDYSGSASTKNERLGAALDHKADDDSDESRKGAKINIRNIYTKDGVIYAAGVYTDDSTDKDVYVVFMKPEDR